MQPSFADRLPAPLLTLYRDDAVRFGTLAFLALRLFTAVAVWLILTRDPVGKPSWLNYDPLNPNANESGETYDQALPPDAPLASSVAPWHRWDTAWYVKIAIQGYRADSAIVFPPLYPILIRVLAPFAGQNYVLSALIVSNVACLIAFILLFKLIEIEFGNADLARRTLLMLVTFPTAYYFVAGYTESVYLAFTLAALLLALRKHWLLAGTLAALASLVRLQGIVLCAPLAWIAYVRLRETGMRAILARLPAVVGGAVGTALYLGYLRVNNLGSTDAVFAHQWALYTRLPWEGIAEFLTRLQANRTFDFELRNAWALLLMAVLSVIVLLRMRPALSLFVFGNLLAILLRYHEGAQFESMIRYSLVLFPCFIAGALLLRRWWLVLLWAAISIPYGYSLLDNFIRWIWVA